VHYNILSCLRSFVYRSSGNPRSALNCDFRIIVIVNRSTDLSTNTHVFIIWTYIYTRTDICIRCSYNDALWNSIPEYSTKYYIIIVSFNIKYYSFSNFIKMLILNILFLWIETYSRVLRFKSYEQTSHKPRRKNQTSTFRLGLYSWIT